MIMMFLFTWVLSGIFAVVACMWLDRKEEDSYKMKDIMLMVAFGYIAVIGMVLYAIHKMDTINLKNPFHKRKKDNE